MTSLWEIIDKHRLPENKSSQQSLCDMS
jgi:hypothetical protein